MLRKFGLMLALGSALAFPAQSFARLEGGIRRGFRGGGFHGGFGGFHAGFGGLHAGFDGFRGGFGGPGFIGGFGQGFYGGGFNRGFFGGMGYYPGWGYGGWDVEPWWNAWGYFPSYDYGYGNIGFPYGYDYFGGCALQRRCRVIDGRCVRSPLEAC